jgi:hypothetical protein
MSTIATIALCGIVCASATPLSGLPPGHITERGPGRLVGRAKGGVPLAGFPPPGNVWKPVKGSWNTPVLTANASTWERTAVQEPQVVFQKETNSLRMWYRGAGWDAPSGVGVAGTSAAPSLRQWTVCRTA